MYELSLFSQMCWQSCPWAHGSEPEKRHVHVMTSLDIIQAGLGLRPLSNMHCTPEVIYASVNTNVRLSKTGYFTAFSQPALEYQVCQMSNWRDKIQELLSVRADDKIITNSRNARDSKMRLFMTKLQNSNLNKTLGFPRLTSVLSPASLSSSVPGSVQNEFTPTTSIQHEVLGKIQVLTWACCLVCIQHISFMTHAKVRITVFDTNMLAVMIPGACIQPWKETLPQLTSTASFLGLWLAQIDLEKL